MAPTEGKISCQHRSYPPEKLVEHTLAIGKAEIELPYTVITLEGSVIIATDYSQLRRLRKREVI